MIVPVLGLVGRALSSCVRSDRIPRSIDGEVVISPSQPAIRVTVAHGLTYLGCVPFKIGSIAHGTRYLFVDADGLHIRRMLILQFEEFTASLNELYRYDMRSAEDIGGYRFRQNAFAFSGEPDPSSGE
jgi:hypothetical protein